MIALAGVEIQTRQNGWLPFLGSAGLFWGSGLDSKMCFQSTNVDQQLWLWKYKPQFFLIWPKMGSFCPFWALQNYFEGWGQIQQSYWELLMQTINFGFYTRVLCSFLFNPIWGLFCPFWTLWGCFGIGVWFKKCLGPTNIDYEFWFWMYSPIFLFFVWLFWGFLALSGPFGAIFGVWVRLINYFGTYLNRQTTLILELQPN